MLEVPHQRQRRWLARLGLAALLYLMLNVVLMGIVDRFGVAQRALPQEADVILILGAGINRDGSPGRALTRRLSHAAELYHRGLAPMLLCSGGMPYNRPRTEAEACRAGLLQRRVPSAAILLEDASRSTEENAANSLPIVQAAGAQRVIVVSDDFHLWRASLIFQLAGYDMADVQFAAAARDGSAWTYFTAVLRESAGLQWLAFKTVFGIQATFVPLI